MWADADVKFTITPVKESGGTCLNLDAEQLCYDGFVKFLTG